MIIHYKIIMITFWFRVWNVENILISVKHTVHII